MASKQPDVLPVMVLLEPPKELLGIILRRISGEQKRATVKRFAFFSIGLAGLATGLLSVAQMAWAELAYSGSLKFAALLFSDFKAVLTFWDSSALLLLEILPMASLIILLGVFAVFLLMLRRWAAELKSFRRFAYNK